MRIGIVSLTSWRSWIGVATSATAVAVKVLSDGGSGTVSNIISGINYAFGQFLASGTPSIATLSVGGAPSTSLDSAVSSVSLFMHFDVVVLIVCGNRPYLEDCTLRSPR